MRARGDAMDGTRRRILEAARRLFLEHWFDDVTLALIAETAGVSHQTVLNHFRSKEGVFAALAEAVEAEVAEREDQRKPIASSAAVRMLLERYEEMGLANARFVVQEHRVPALHDLLERARTQHRAWVERTFAGSLQPSGPERRRKIAALLAATEVMAWKALRHDYGFSRSDTAAAITALVTCIEEQR